MNYSYFAVVFVVSLIGQQHCTSLAVVQCATTCNATLYPHESPERPKFEVDMVQVTYLLNMGFTCTFVENIFGINRSERSKNDINTQNVNINYQIYASYISVYTKGSL